MERLLASNILDALGAAGGDRRLRVVRGMGRIYVVGFETEEESSKYLEVLSRVMGVVSISPALLVEFSDLNDLVERASEFFEPRVRGSSFAVRARRVGAHDFTSVDVARLVGRELVERTGLRVDLTSPDYTARIEIVNDRAYFYDKIVRGPGGLPIGSEGYVISLFSGGIDSPVASWFMMRRGCAVDLLLFNIAGSEQVEVAKEVARELMSKWGYGYRPKLFVVDLRPAVSRIVASVPESYIVVVLRRLMMRVASKLAKALGAKAIVTGESVGQAASQTLDNLSVIDQASEVMVLRPLLGLDKDEIVKYAKRIGTYDCSIRLPEYCPVGARRVTTMARLDKVLKYEGRVGISDGDVERLASEAKAYDIKELESKN